MRALWTVGLLAALSLPGLAQMRGGGRMSGGRNYGFGRQPGNTYVGAYSTPGSYGAPQLPPGAGLNGLPAFSTQYIHFNCSYCAPVRTASYGGGFGVPLLGGFIGSAYPMGATSADIQVPATAAPSASGIDTAAVDLGMQLEKLSEEVRQLRAEQDQPPQQQASIPATAPARASAPQSEEPPTVVVLRDGTRLEVRDYAVMNGTFWDFSAHPVKKIPLRNLDLRASARENAARGVDFPPADLQATK